jgi:hypothetical protein
VESGTVAVCPVEAAEQVERGRGPLNIAGERDGLGAFADDAGLPVVGQGIAVGDQDMRAEPAAQTLGKAGACRRSRPGRCRSCRRWQVPLPVFALARRADGVCRPLWFGHVSAPVRWHAAGAAAVG